MGLNFVNSVDFNRYSSRHRSKIEATIAVKKLKPGLGRLMTDKITHEKNIVRRMKGVTSYFIPKFYGTC